MTRKYKILYKLFLFLSIVCLLAPIAIYTVKGLIIGSVVQKFTLGMMGLTALILVLFNLLWKARLRSPLFILLLGIYLTLEYIAPVLLLVALGTIADELIFTPLYKKYKNLYTINKEIDKR